MWNLSKLPTRRWLVTGSSGFIGTRLVRRLRADGQEVVPYDLQDEVRAEDILDETQVMRSCIDVDFVVHLAAISSVGVSIAHPERTKQVNEEGTRLVLRAAEYFQRIRKVVYASSAAVYTVSVPGCSSPYATSKEANERTASLHPKAVGLRFFNVYGPGANPGSVVPQWLAATQRGSPLPVHGSLDEVRDYIHVSDVVEAVIAAAFYSDLPEPRVFDIGTGVATSLRGLAAMIERVAGKPNKYGPSPAGEPPTPFYSCARPAPAWDRLGWRAKVGLESGLETLL